MIAAKPAVTTYPAFATAIAARGEVVVHVNLVATAAMVSASATYLVPVVAAPTAE